MHCTNRCPLYPQKRTSALAAPALSPCAAASATHIWSCKPLTDQNIANVATVRPQGCAETAVIAFGGLGPPEDLVDVVSGTPKQISKICPIGHESAGCHKFPNSVKRRQLLPS